MGNFVIRDSWIGQQQLRFVEQVIWWNGTLSRSEIIEKFRVSPQQATAIIQSYLEINPKAMKYSLKIRKYYADPQMKCVFKTPSFADEILSDEERLGGMLHPLKKIAPEIPRNLIVAMRQNKSLKLTYQHTKASEPETRRIIPHAFGHDGVRYLVRAWCESRLSFQDFFLLKISSIDWPDVDVTTELPEDKYWNIWDEVRVKINDFVNDDIKEELMNDYDLESPDDPIIIKCRQAMKPHILFRLGLDPYSTLGGTAFFQMA